MAPAAPRRRTRSARTVRCRRPRASPGRPGSRTSNTRVLAFVVICSRTTSRALAASNRSGSPWIGSACGIEVDGRRRRPVDDIGSVVIEVGSGRTRGGRQVGEPPFEHPADELAGRPALIPERPYRLVGEHAVRAAAVRDDLHVGGEFGKPSGGARRPGRTRRRGCARRHTPRLAGRRGRRRRRSPRGAAVPRAASLRRRRRRGRPPAPVRSPRDGSGRRCAGRRTARRRPTRPGSR